MFAFPGTTNAANEQSSEGIAASPVIQRYRLNAGESKQDSVTIINDGETAFDFILYARPYSVKGELYDPDFQTSSPSTDVYRWIQFEKTSYRLDPHQRITVPYTINVPDSAATGGHYGVIFAETQPAKTDNSSVVRKKRVGTLVFTTVNGTIRQTGTITEMNIPFWQTEPPLATSLKINSTGNTDFVASSKITVKDLFGNTKYSHEINYSVLPSTTRKVDLKWDGAPWFGLFQTTLDTKALDRPTSQTSYVLILPRYVPFVIVFVLIIGGGYAAYRRSKRA